MLSAMPGVKRIVKKFYILVNAALYGKKYRYRILDRRVGEMKHMYSGAEETFYGYYDHSPESETGRVLVQRTQGQASRYKPTADHPVEVGYVDSKCKYHAIGKSTSYNWQQGCRPLWIGTDRVIYNVWDSGRYRAVIYNFATGKEERRMDHPVQDYGNGEFYLSVNPARIMSLNPEYGYRNATAEKAEELRRLDNDGVWRVDLATGEAMLLHTLEEIVALHGKPLSEDSLHCVNHIMMSPDGNRFIMIHRWYHKGRRYDRLILSESGDLKVLVDEDMVSHMCWIGNDRLFGYFRHNKEDGFYFIDPDSGNIEPFPEMTSLGQGDGHPAVSGRWIAIDSYPDRSQMQHLTLVDPETREIIPVAEFYHGPEFTAESRCDLHPRFSPDGGRIWIDTVCNGKRELAYIDVSSITKRN